MSATPDDGADRHDRDDGADGEVHADVVADAHVGSGPGGPVGPRP
ncbi:MAG: hypothetical protein R2710_30005 [Acidimicrobiales bacterium]